MKLWSDSFTDGGVIPADCAFAVIDPAAHVRLGANHNPHLAWDEVPAGTESLVLFMRDLDAPSVGTDVNQQGRVVAANAPRTEFFHWTLVDIPVALRAITQGKFSQRVTPHGKHGPQLPLSIKNGAEHRLRQGLNDYTSWFKDEPDMAGDYYGYDGPGPPWNDERVHTYLCSLYALDIAQLDVAGRFGGPDARLAICGHILDEAHLFGVYSLNPAIAHTLE